jgi:hypothetical protein
MSGGASGRYLNRFQRDDVFRGEAPSGAESQLTSCSVSYRTNLITHHGSSPDSSMDTQTLAKFARRCKFSEPARICLKVKMPAYHISIICTCPLGRIDKKK